MARHPAEAVVEDASALWGMILPEDLPIGEIETPAELLGKPTRLSEIERRLIQNHAAVGAELLSRVDFPWPIADIVGQHHERYDGSGYPNGLAGDGILLEARILAVADTLEAMASHRLYRAALGLQAAADELRDGAGVRYDPAVVEACLAQIDAGRIGIETD